MLYVWTGRQDGAPAAGKLEAAARADVVRTLRSSGIVPISIQPAARPGVLATPAPGAAAAEAATGATAPGSGMGRLLQRGVRPAERMLMYQQLGTQLDAGIAMLDALQALSASSTTPTLRALLDAIAERIRAGSDLSSALSAHPHVFDRFCVAMVRVGETSGSLATIFAQLAEHEEFSLDMRRQIKAALRYPGFVVLAMVAAIVVINIFVIPTFEGLFRSFKAQLPLLTRILIASSNLTINYWWLALLGAGGAGWSFSRWKRSEAGRMAWDRFILRLPIIGPSVRKAMLARFGRALAIATGAGVPIEQALGLVAQTLDNVHMSTRIGQMRQAIAHGDTIQAAAAASGEFTPMVLQMIGVGEHTGRVEQMMDKVARYYAEEVRASLRTLAQSIEPILIVGIAGLVLVVALGVMLPLWQINQLAMHK